MLARTFKTADELGLPHAEYEALLKVLGAFERREIPKNLFDMGYIGQPECGSSGCLIGWARALTGTLVKVDCLSSNGLARLCYPYHIPNDAAFSASRAQSEIALRNYLTRGEPAWDEALAPK